MRRPNFTAHAGSWGTTICRLETPAGQCESPATRHLLIRVGGLTGGMNACERCFLFLVQSRVAYIEDLHAFGDYCNLPESAWIPSDANGHGTCRLPDDLTAELERFANQSQGVSV